MQYTDYECPVCSAKFGNDDDIVVCPVCGTPHHRNCWRENGGCKNEDKHGSGFVWNNSQNGVILPDPANAENTNMKICPRCGEKNASFEPVCVRCGERLKANRQTINDSVPDYNRKPFYGYGENPNPNNFSPYQNAYAADARTLYGADAKIDDIPATEIAEFIQKKSNKYVGDFLDMQEKNTNLKWNWSAAVFSVFWVFYRKMTALGFAIVAILFSVNLISSSITPIVYEKYRPEVYAQYEADVQEVYDMMSDMLESGTRNVPSNYYPTFARIVFSPVSVMSYIIQIGAYLIAAVIMGFFGNYFYKKKIVKDINSLRRVAVDSMSYHMYLTHRGGVSHANVLLPILCYMVLNLIMTYI